MSMWTTTDQTAVKQAVLDLAQGKRKVRVSYSSEAGGGTTEYGQADLPQLRALLADINGALNVKRRSFRVRTSK